MKFLGPKLSWEGQALVKKPGRRSVGGEGQNFCRLGGPLSPTGKKNHWSLSVQNLVDSEVLLVPVSLILFTYPVVVHDSFMQPPLIWKDWAHGFVHRVFFSLNCSKFLDSDERLKNVVLRIDRLVQKHVGELVSRVFSWGDWGVPQPAKILSIPPSRHLSLFLDQGWFPPSWGLSPKIWKFK